MSDQAAFRAGLLDPATPAPDGLRDADNGPAGKRYDVYRNNVTHSLCEALEAAFPLVRKLIGAKLFADLAPLYVRAHPPCSPLMMFYGAEFPGFLDKFGPLQHIEYLSDAARLDRDMRTSYHAADADILDPAYLQDLIPADLMASRFAPAPATIVLRSAWPLHDIWRYSFNPETEKPKPVAQDILITRPAFDPAPHILPSGGADWLNALADGQTFDEAFETAAAAHPAFDLQAVLTLALDTGALEHPKTRN